MRGATSVRQRDAADVRTSPAVEHGVSIGRPDRPSAFRVRGNRFHEDGQHAPNRNSSQGCPSPAVPRDHSGDSRFRLPRRLASPSDLLDCPRQDSLLRTNEADGEAGARVARSRPTQTAHWRKRRTGPGPARARWQARGTFRPVTLAWNRVPGRPPPRQAGSRAALPPRIDDDRARGSNDNRPRNQPAGNATLATRRKRGEAIPASRIAVLTVDRGAPLCPVR